MARLQEVAHRIETRFDRLKQRLGARLGLSGPAMVQPYHGIGTANDFWVRGRVMTDQGVVSAVHSDSVLVNIRHTLRRYETDEIPGARLSWSFGASGGTVATGEEGFFDFHFDPGSDFDPQADWQDVHFILQDASPLETRPLGATVRVRTPRRGARFVLVSDIDDTIVHTGATNFLKHWRTVVANSAKSRQGYEGLPELYRALCAGADGPATNPVFYVSSSPWNLFDLFDRYMIINGIPRGPMLLKDFGLDGSKWLTGGHDGHKSRMIDKVAASQPHLPLLLIGDSGQRDLEIYADVAQRYGAERIAAIVVHDVTGMERRADVRATLARLRDEGILAFLTSDYHDARDRLVRAGLLRDAEAGRTALAKAA